MDFKTSTDVCSIKKERLKDYKIMFIDKQAIIRSESDFGYKCISPYLLNQKKNYKVLEVGSGTGMLISALSQSYTNIIFEAIEPFSNGFEGNRKLKEKWNNKNINIYDVTYEKFKPEIKYDFIYLINVFEHLKNWKHFIQTVTGWLNQDGRCIILCPNYSFPYESHFKIPIIINKKITKSLFNNKIKNHEKEYGSCGLWDSLNLVKKTSVLQFCKLLDLKVKDNNNIHQILVDRFIEDKQFRNRQSFVGSLGLFLNYTKTLKLFSFPIIKNYAPYMMLEIKK